MYENRKKLLIGFGVIGCVALVLVLCFLFGPNASDNEKETEPSATVPVIEETHPNSGLKESTIPWSNGAWHSNIDEKSVISISFVKEKPNKKIAIHWEFDGMHGYQDEGDVYFVVGNGVKILGSMECAFAEFPNLKEIHGLGMLDTSAVTNMSGLFKNDTSLENIDIQKINMSSVINAKEMFFNCSALKTLDMSGMDVKKAEDMSYIWSDCTSLDTLSVPDTKAVKSLSYAMNHVGRTASATTTLVGTLNTENCEDMSYMFNGSYFKTYDAAQNFKTTSLKTTEGMFYECGTENMDLSSWQTANLENTSKMFYWNGWMSKCNLSGWDMSSLKNCEFMFTRCSNLKKLSIDWKNLHDMQSVDSIFSRCYLLTEIDVSCFDGLYFGNAHEMFGGCGRLTTIYGAGFNAEVSDDMFRECTSLVGAVAYDDKNTDVSMANTDGYFTAMETKKSTTSRLKEGT